MSDSLKNLAQSRTFALRNGTLAALDDGQGQDAGVATLAAGSVIEAKYEVLALIGQGGMGAVYKVRHLLLEKEMALKTFRSHNISQEAWHRFQREARAIAKLKHKNIVEVYDFGITESKLPYYTMELLHGHGLDAAIAEEGAVETEEALRIFLQAASGLAHAHAHDIVHRDIKPANIFLQDALSKNGLSEVKIVDFGIAKFAEDLSDADGQSATQVGMIFGSPLYMSPEQSLGLPLDKRTDIYSFGCALYETLAGKPPFVGDTALITLMCHQTQKPPSLSGVVGSRSISQRLEQAVRRMLEKNVENRYQSFNDVMGELSVCAQAFSYRHPFGQNVERAAEFVSFRREQDSDGTDASSKNTKILVITIVAILAVGAFLGTLAWSQSHQAGATNPVSLKQTTVTVKETTIAGTGVRDFAPESTTGKTATATTSKATASTTSASTTSASTTSAGPAPAGTAANDSNMSYLVNEGADSTSIDNFKKEREVEVKKSDSFLVSATASGIVFQFPNYASIGTVVDKSHQVECKGRVALATGQGVDFTANEEICRSPQLLNRFPSYLLFKIRLLRMPDDCYWTDAAIPYVVRQSRLEELNISFCTQVDASVLPQVGKLKRLIRLDITDAKIDGKELSTLKNLPQLKVLTLNRTKNVPFLVAFMAKNPGSYQLEKFVSEECELDDESVRLLSKLPGLWQLFLSDNKIKGSTLSLLKNERHLELLSLGRNKISSEGLLSLGQLKQLQKLEISKSCLTPESEKRLREQLSMCRIVIVD